MKRQPTGRRPERQPVREIGGFAWAGLALLLVAPAIAISRMRDWLDWRIMAGAAIGASLLTVVLYRSDKRRAEAGEWRTPESTLHLAELCGGWPGAFLAQRKFRHKISKSSYQVVFWLIVAAHQFVAIDSTIEWRFTTHAVSFVQSQTTALK